MFQIVQMCHVLFVNVFFIIIINLFLPVCCFRVYFSFLYIKKHFKFYFFIVCLKIKWGGVGGKLFIFCLYINRHTFKKVHLFKINAYAKLKM